MIAAILSFVAWLLGLIFPSKDERDKERDAGEKLGRAETENSNAQRGLDELQTAVAARDADHAANAADPGRLSGPDAEGARPYRPGPD